MNEIDVIKIIFKRKNTVPFNEYKTLKDSIFTENNNIKIDKLKNIINNNQNDNIIYLFNNVDSKKYFIFYYNYKFYIGGPYINNERYKTKEAKDLSVVSDLTMIRIINFIGELLFDNNYKVSFISYDYKILSNVSSFDFDGIIDGFEDAIIEEFYDREKELIKSVRNGNRRQAIAIINDLIYINNNSIGDFQSQKMFLIYLNSILKFSLLDTDLNINSINKIHLHYHKIINGNNYSFKDLVLDMIRSYCVLVYDFSYDKYSDTVRNCLEYIEANINKSFTIKKMSCDIGINASYLSTRFKKELDSSVIDYINYRKIHNSLTFYNDYTMQVKDICLKVGINDYNYYSRVFKKIMGMTPTQYRKQIKDNVQRDRFHR